jgi:tripartite-type tricarboxylate transporter receptor subunit TctC
MRKVLLAFAMVYPALSAAAAQPYPSRPVTLIVPLGAGGPVDSVARILSDAMRTSLGQPVIIENVTGASGTIGVARACRRLHREHRELALAHRQRSDLCAAL